MTVSYMNL